MQQGTASFESIRAVVYDATTGSTYVAGDTGGTLYSTQPDGTACFVARIDNDLQTTTWGVHIDGVSTQTCYGIAINPDSGLVYVTGITRASLYDTYPGGNDIFVASLDMADGSVVWGAQLGTSGDETGRAISVHSSTGDVFVVGATSGSLFDTNAGGDDTFIAAFDGSDGTQLWGVQLGTSSSEAATGVDSSELAGEALVVVCGRTSGSLFATSAGSGDVAVWAVNGSDGSTVWSTQFGTASNEEALDVSIDATRGLAILGGTTQGDLFGTSAGLYDVFAAAVSTSTGAVQWGVQLGSDQNDFCNGIDVDETSGRTVLAGLTEGDLFDTNSGSRDAFVAKLDSDAGHTLGGVQFGTSDDDSAYDVAAVEGTGTAIAVGYTDADLFATSAGSSDIFYTFVE